MTKLLYPRLEPTPTTEPDDPLHQAAVNLQRQQEIEESEKALSGTPARSFAANSQSVPSHPRSRPDSAKGIHAHVLMDLEKGSVTIEQKRLSRESGRDKEEEKKKVQKAVVRVEIHDTGVGLKKTDVLEYVFFLDHYELTTDFDTKSVATSFHHMSKPKSAVDRVGKAPASVSPSSVKSSSFRAVDWVWRVNSARGVCSGSNCLTLYLLRPRQGQEAAKVIRWRVWVWVAALLHILFPWRVGAVESRLLD